MYLDCRRENPNERRDEHMRGPILIDASVIGNRFPLAQQGADSHVMMRKGADSRKEQGADSHDDAKGADSQ